MRVGHWLLGLVLVVALAVVGCGPSTSSNEPQEEIATPPLAESSTDTGVWTEYRDYLLAWAEGIAGGGSEKTGEEGQSSPFFDESGYPDHSESQLQNLRYLERLKPPPELAELHQNLVEAFLDFCRADELYRETQAAKNYLAAIRAGLLAQQQLDRVNRALLEVVQALKAPASGDVLPGKTVKHAISHAMPGRPLRTMSTLDAVS